MFTNWKKRYNALKEELEAVVFEDLQIQCKLATKIEEEKKKKNEIYDKYLELAIWYVNLHKEHQQLKQDTQSAVKHIVEKHTRKK